MTLLKNPHVTRTIKLLISAALLYALIDYIDFQTVIASLSAARPMYIICGTILVLANVGIQYLRWKFLLDLISPDVTRHDALSSLLVGFSAGFFTPAQIGEFGGRIASLHNHRASCIAGMNLIDRLYILGMTILIGTVTIVLYFEQVLPQYWNPVYSFAGVVIFVISLILFLYPSVAKKVLYTLPDSIRQHRFYGMIEVIETSFHTREARIMFTQTLVFIGIIILQYYFFLNAFEDVPFSAALLCVPNILLIKSVILPISIGDLGVRETTSVFFLTRLGVSAATAFDASICIFFVNIFLPSLIGALSILRLRWETKKEST